MELVGARYIDRFHTFYPLLGYLIRPLKIILGDHSDILWIFILSEEYETALPPRSVYLGNSNLDKNEME